METRFALVGGILVVGIAVTAAVVRSPRSSPVSAFPAEQSVNRPTGSAPVQSDRPEERAPVFSGGRVRAGLFARPTETLPPTAAPPTSSVPPPARADPSPPAPDEFAEYVYTGTVTTEGQMHALLENARTGEGGYLQRGDTFLGARVVAVDADAVTLDVQGQRRRIPKSNAYNVVPLNAQAQAPVDQNAPNPGAADAAKASALIYTSDLQGAYQILQGTPLTSQITFTSGSDSPAATDNSTVDFDILSYNP